MYIDSYNKVMSSCVHDVTHMTCNTQNGNVLS